MILQAVFQQIINGPYLQFKTYNTAQVFKLHDIATKTNNFKDQFK